MFSNLDILILVLMLASTALTAYIGFTYTMLSWVQLGFSSSLAFATWNHFFNPANSTTLITNSYLGAGIVLFAELCVLLYVFKRLKSMLAGLFKDSLGGIIDVSLGGVFGFLQGIVLSLCVFIGITVGCGGLTFVADDTGKIQHQFQFDKIPNGIKSSLSYGLLKSGTNIFIGQIPGPQLKIFMYLSTISMLMQENTETLNTPAPAINQQPVAVQKEAAPVSTQEKEQLMNLLQGILQKKSNT